MICILVHHCLGGGGGACDFELLTPGGLPTGASLLSGRHVACSCLHPVTPDDLHTGVSLLGAGGGRGGCDFEVLTPGGLPTGASLLSGRHVALRCLCLVVCPQAHHC